MLAPIGPALAIIIPPLLSILSAIEEPLGGLIGFVLWLLMGG
jgi:hypothetical protein